MSSFVKALLRIVAYSCLIVFPVLILVLCSLLLFEHPVPHDVLERVMSSCSSSNLLIRARSATYNLRYGVRLWDVRVVDKGHLYGRQDGPAGNVFTASRVDFALDLHRLPWSKATILRAVTIHDLSYPRLPRGYYVPDSVEFPGRPDYTQVDEPLVLKLPELRPFEVRLLRPKILGIDASEVDVHAVEVTSEGISAKGIRLRWPISDVPMEIRGEVALNLVDQVLRGEVQGMARQCHIRPMLVALDITNSYQFIDAFTNVERPVDAGCRFEVNLRNNDLQLWLNLHPWGGCYRGVPLQDVYGRLDIRVFVRDTYQNAQITVGPLLGNLADGSIVEGTVFYENTNDVGFVNFRNVRTRAPIKDVLAIANVWTDGTLDCLSVTNCSPILSLDGRLAVEDAHASANSLTGTLAFAEGAFLGIPLRGVSTVFHVEGTSVNFTEARARSLHGGAVLGSGTISVPESRHDLASFKVKLTGRSLALTDLAGALGVDPGDKRGEVFGDVELAGPLSRGTNSVAALVGGGHLECRDGHLAQMKLFAGLTDYLVAHVPGIAGLVNLSHSSSDFVLKDGVFASTNVVVEGSILSVRAAGKYDIINDNLDFRAHVELTKNDTLFAKLATPITWPFSNLAKVLLDFRLLGSLDNPSWTYSRNPLDLLPLGK